VWVPESIHHFNVEGRSATDGADQNRKKMAMAERRITRQGHKGIAFVFDIAFSNAHIMWEMVHLAAVDGGVTAAMRRKLSKVAYCLAWDCEIASSATSLRTRMKPSILAAGSSTITTAPQVAASPSKAPRAQHELLRCSKIAMDATIEAATAAWRAKHPRGPLPKTLAKLGVKPQEGSKGKCCLEKLGKCITKAPKLARHKCLQCGGRDGAFYHEKCFWSAHMCTYNARVRTPPSPVGFDYGDENSD